MTQMRWLSSAANVSRVRFSNTPSRVQGAPIGQLGNPDAGVSLSIGVGGLLLFGLAAYGIWRLARG